MRRNCVFFLILSIGVPQAINANDADLADYGQTPLQQTTGSSITQTCDGFASAGTQPGTVALYDTCSAIVATANNLQGEEPSELSLGLNEDELAAAFQQISTEEYAATGAMANEIASGRVVSIVSRLFAIRGGIRGFNLSSTLYPVEHGFTFLGEPRAVVKRGAGAGDDLLDNALSGFMNISYGNGDRDATASADAFDYTNYRLILGGDYRLDQNLVLGGALNFNRINADFEERLTVTGGGIESDGWGGVVYGTYYDDIYYIDGLVGYAASSYEIERHIFIPSNTAAASIIETATGHTDSSDYSVSFGAGLKLNSGPIAFGPYFRASYLRVDIDGYQEKGAEASGLNFNVEEQDWTSLTSVLGMEYSYVISAGGAVITPHLKLGWIHQFEHDSSEIIATYVDDPRNNQFRVLTDDPDRNYLEFSFGVSSVLENGFQLFANYNTLLGLDYLRDHQLTLGGRWEF